jgi:hypothetical protein
MWSLLEEKRLPQIDMMLSSFANFCSILEATRLVYRYPFAELEVDSLRKVD